MDGTETLDIKFDCTMCAGCCHSLRVPLSVSEARSWSERGGEIEIYCDAWVPFAPTGDKQADDAESYRFARSFGAASNARAVRVSVTLVGAFDGPCPFLLKDLRCGAYEQRPAVCRVYPAEINPAIPFSIARKQCPSEAWSAAKTPFLTGGKPLPETQKLIDDARQAGVDDMAAKERLCAAFGLDTAGLSNEGYTIHRPLAADFQKALAASLAQGASQAADRQWTIVTNQAESGKVLQAAGLDVLYKGGQPVPQDDYVGFYKAT